MLTHRETSPVRLLHIVGRFPLRRRRQHHLACGQVAQAEGWQVDVLSTDPVFQKAARQHGLGWSDLDVIRREIRPVWDLGGLFRLAVPAETPLPNRAHPHLQRPGSSDGSPRGSRGVPVIVHTAHGFAFHEDSPAATRRFYSALERLASHWCDRIVSVSEFHRDWAIELGICNPRQSSRFPMGSPTSPARAGRRSRSFAVKWARRTATS